jgi:long-chain acyl-CoA synthetase
MAVDPTSAAMILYTSGTTGEAKGALISHRALVTHTRVLVDDVLRLGEGDRVLGVLPLAHSFGCRMVMLASLRAGCRCVLVPRFGAAASLAAMIEERITWVPAVPTMYAAWGSLPEGPRPEALRWCLAAGSPMADEIARRAEARLGVEVRQAYGMTEATISTLNTPPDERIYGCVGRPAPGIEVRIVDEHDRDAAPGATGEVVVRGHNLMTGYLDDPAATAEAMRGGWMHTGDVGRLDEAGRLFVVDRLKDMIIRGGNNVYPSEVEAALASHPGVREVAVVGRPDDYLGEEVVAVVVPRGTGAPPVEELRDWAAARVAATKVPREYAFVETLPLGPSRKVLKRELRDRVASGSLRPVRAPAARGSSSV